MKKIIQLLSLLLLLVACSPAGNTYYILTPSADGLATGDLVVRQGVPVGKVTDIGLEGRQAKITIQLESGTELYEDQEFDLGYHDGNKAIEFEAPDMAAEALADGATIEALSLDMKIDGMLEGLGAGLNEMMEGLGGGLGDLSKGLEGLSEAFGENMEDWGKALEDLDFEGWEDALKDLNLDEEGIRDMVEKYGDSIRINGQNLRDYMQENGAELKEQLQEL